jgi:16S rRNA (guanine966-N2)-methyltransferase
LVIYDEAEDLSMTNKKCHSSIRIIGGKWRGRRMQFPILKGLRPTHSRVRETLFNWLQHDISEATCLDLFAGSGALGIEALSRGAKHVTFCDSSRLAVQSIKDNLARLDCLSAEVICAPIPGYSFSSKSPLFDIVFLDPPFECDLLQKTVVWLSGSNSVSKETLFYCEFDKSYKETFDAMRLNIIRLKKTGKVFYGLFTLPDVSV